MKTGGCGCAGGRRKTRKQKKTRGGSLVGDAVLAGTAVGLYSYFKKKGGSRVSGGSKKTRKLGLRLPRMPTRRTRWNLAGPRMPQPMY